MPAPAASLSSIFAEHRRSIGLTWTLLLLETGFTVAQPLLIGLAIDDLLAGGLSGLALAGGAFVGRMVFGVGRRMYDTRTYARIYATVATRTVVQQQGRGVKLSAVATRSNLVRELVTFFEHDLTQGLVAALTALGALVMLAAVDWRVLLACVASLVPIAAVYLLTERRIYALNTGYNDELERQVDVLEAADPGPIEAHYGLLAGWQVRLSDREAINYGWIEAALIALLIAALLLAANVAEPTPGGIFATLSYAREFALGVYVLPWLYQQVIRLREITSRLAVP